MLLRLNDAPPRGWSSVPGPSPIPRPRIADGTTLSYYGYTFEVPWKEIDRERNEGSTVEVLFKTGQIVKFNNPSYFDWNPINSFSGQVDQGSFRQAFDAGVHQSKYEQFEAVISATPAKLSPLRSHTDFARSRTLLEIKGLWFEHSVAASDIFLSRPRTTEVLKTVVCRTAGKMSCCICSIGETSTGSQSLSLATIVLA